MATASAQKTITFEWEGTDKQGRKTKGEVASININLAKAQLRKQGINATKVKKKAGDSFLGNMGAPKILPGDIALFTRQLATMMKAGVPLVQSFDIVAGGVDNITMANLARSIKDDVASGSSFAGALKKHPQYFDQLFVNLVDSGEQSGALETMLDRVATYKEKSEALKAKVKKALKYPISVIVIAVIVSAVLLIKVVPTFQDLFSSFGAELPAFTQMVIGLSEWMQEWWFIVLISIALIGQGFSQGLKRSQAFRDACDRIQLKIPIVGEIMYKSAMARFARTLSTTFAAGVPLVDALDSVAGATGNVVFERACFTVKDDVSSGTALNYSMKMTEIFPNMMIQMVAIGEESGALDSMLDKAASFYEEEVDNAVDGLTSLMEPLIMGVLGILVGGLIIAMYLPIFQLGSVV